MRHLGPHPVILLDLWANVCESSPVVLRGGDDMETARIARILDEIGTMLEVQGENPFRCRAYHNAADALKGLPDNLAAMVEDGSLAEVPGIGATMLAKIA